MPKKMGMATMKPFHITTIRSNNLKFTIRDKEIQSEEEAKDEVERLNSNPNVKKIDLMISSPEVYNGFYIDLPGLFYVSKGDKELPKRIQDITESYLQNRNNIPCIVTSATADPATNQAIQLINEHGREMESMGVITKVDLAKNKLDTVTLEAMISGKDTEYSLGHGWVAVVLKNTEDNKKGMTVGEKIEVEKRFFEKYPKFSPAGVEAMRERLSRIQFERVKENIPRILTDIDKSIEDLVHSGNFLEKICADPKNQLSFRLKMMVEKLVGSSLERAEFENELKSAFCEAVNNHLKPIEEDQFGKILWSLPLSDIEVDPAIKLYHYDHGTVSRAYNDSDHFRELFSFGLVSPIAIDQTTIQRAFDSETSLLCSVPLLYILLNDPIGKKRIMWNKSLQKMFNTLLEDDRILEIVYEVTEREIIKYLKPDNGDDLTQKFSEYIVREIGSEAYESKIKFSIKAMINTEKRPDISLVEITRHMAAMHPKLFDWNDKTFTDYYLSSTKRLEIDVYGRDFNRAYIMAVKDKLIHNIYRNVAVNLLDRMVEKLLEMTIDMFNTETVRKEKTKVQEKISKLRELRSIIERYI